MKKNKNILLLVIATIVVLIFLSIFSKNKNNQVETVPEYLLNNSSEKPNPTPVVDEKLQKMTGTHTFWFPYKNIVLVKTVDNFYQAAGQTGNIKDLKNIQDTKTIKTTSQELISQGYTLDKNFSGLFAVNSMFPYYLSTYKKGNNWCQIENQLETSFDEGYVSDGYSYACFDFNLDQAYNQQKPYYQLAGKEYQSAEYAQAIIKVEKNSNSFTKITINAKGDGSMVILDKNNKEVCVGKPCCYDESDTQTYNDNWCTNYKIIY